MSEGAGIRFLSYDDSPMSVSTVEKGVRRQLGLSRAIRHRGKYRSESEPVDKKEKRVSLKDRSVLKKTSRACS